MSAALARTARRAAIALALLAGCGGGTTQLPTVDASGGAAQAVALGPRIAFWVLAVMVIGGALVTITRRNAVTAVMALVATFFALAALYTLLSAHFLAAIQVLVYAGAIMTLFVFVVMLLNREEAEPWARRGVVTRAVGVGVGVYSLVWLGTFLLRKLPAGADQVGLPDAGWGGVASTGEVLFNDYLFPFEAISLLLIVAVIGAVVVARIPKKKEESAIASDSSAGQPQPGGHP